MLLFVLVSSVCCSEEPTHCDGGISSRAVRFAVTETDAWGALPYMKGDSVGGSDRKGLTIGKFVLRDERQEECLFLDAVLLRGITKEGDAKHAGVETRSAPVTDLATYGAFGISGYVYDAVWDGTQNPDFMYDVEVSRSNGDVWVPDRNYFLPNTGQSVRFYAWAPYRDAALSISERDEAGAPVFSWQVQPEVIEQQDLLVASSGELATDDRSTIQLRFRHVLTAVKFTAGEMLAGKITRIALKGVYGSGSYTVDALGWNDYDTLMDFEQRLDVAVDGSSDIEITSGAATFMMIPQTLPEGATVEVEFTDDLTGMRRTLTADIGGTTWPVGQTVCYRISTQSISVVPRLEVTPPADFTYEGGKAAYSVRSCLEVSRAGDETRLLPAAWTAEFSTDDGMTWTTEKPDWLTAFVSAGDGGSTAVEYSAEVVSQTGVTSDPHGDALRAAIPVSGIYNLSNATGAAPVENTANCYLVHAPGTYSLPLVYGNAIRDGEVYPESYTSTITDAQVLSAFVNHLGEAITSPYIYKNENCVPKAAALLWQDEKDLVDAQSVKLTDDDSDGVFDHLQFTIPSGDTFKQGNAVLALFDKDDESNIEGTNALWSWHIWVTDYRLGEDLGTVVSSGTAYSFMPLNLGWCAGEQTSYAGRSVKVRSGRRWRAERARRLLSCSRPSSFSGATGPIIKTAARTRCILRRERLMTPKLGTMQMVWLIRDSIKILGTRIRRISPKRFCSPDSSVIIGRWKIRIPTYGIRRMMASGVSRFTIPARQGIALRRMLRSSPSLPQQMRVAGKRSQKAMNFNVRMRMAHRRHCFFLRLVFAIVRRS